MNKKIIVSALIAAFVATSAPAFSQNRNHQNDHGSRHHDNDRGHGNARSNERANQAKIRGAGPRHDMHKGARLPSKYRGRQYVVNDWRGHRLSAPPRGQQWVQVGGDYVLTAVATGIILQVLLGN